MIQSIIACPQTLIELVCDPDSNQGYAEFDERRNALNQLKNLINSYKLNLYVLPSSLILIHTLLRKKANENFANRAISELVSLGNVQFEVDYGHAMETAISLLQDSSENGRYFDIPLYEALVIPAALDLRVSALIIVDPSLLRSITELCGHQPGFDVPILSIQEAVSHFSESGKHSFSNENYILARTPKGTIKKLRQGSTVIDFAYAVHTDIGSKCVGAKVNHLDAPLDRVLCMNDLVEIILSDNVQTDDSWLKFAKTRTARKAIKQSIRKSFQDKGWALIKRQFNIRTARPQLDSLARKMNITTNRLVERIGRETFTIEDLSISLQEIIINQISYSSESCQDNDCFIVGISNSPLKQSLSSCCTPFPGDGIVGIVGINDSVIRIHCTECEHIANIQQDKLVNAIWGCSSCSVEIYLAIKDSPDVLRQILNLLDENGLTTDLRNVQTSNLRSAQTSKELARSTITLPVSSRSNMDQILKLLQAVPNVNQVKVKKTYPVPDVVKTDINPQPRFYNIPSSKPHQH